MTTNDTTLIVEAVSLPDLDEPTGRVWSLMLLNDNEQRLELEGHPLVGAGATLADALRELAERIDDAGRYRIDDLLERHGLDAQAAPLPKLLDSLCCPVCSGAVKAHDDGKGVICTECHTTSFPK